MTSLAPPVPRKLPVWSTIAACYAAVARNLGQLVRIAWLWLLIMLPVYATLLWLQWEWQHQDAMLIPALLVYFIELLFLGSVAVAWHRLLLRQERVTAPAYLRLLVIFGITLPSLAYRFFTAQQTEAGATAA